MSTPAANRWSLVLEEVAESELSLRAFARSRGLNPNTLAWWKWRLGQTAADRSDKAGFLEVVAPRAETESGWSGLRVEVGGARVQVDSDSDLNLLRRVVEALS